MNAVQEEFTRIDAGETQEHRLARYLMARPGEWVPMPTLALVITPTGIGAAVHSRVAGARRRFGMTIEQRRGKNTATGLCKSDYRYLPFGACEL